MKLISLQILFILFFSFSLSSQNQDFENIDTILYMKEMSAYLDTSFLNRFEKDILKYEKKDSLNGIDEGKILFLGSSSFRIWSSMQKDLFPLNVLNRGFGGSTLPEAIYYFNRIAMPYKPSKIVLYEGDNDIMATFLTPYVILDAFKLFVRMRDKYLPDTKIYFLSIKPSPRREKVTDKLLITNMLIEEYCKEIPDLEYIDITEPMYEEYGEIRQDIFKKDMLHMNKAGYKIWSKIIKDSLLH